MPNCDRPHSLYALEKEIHGHRRRQEAEDLNEHDDDHVARTIDPGNHADVDHSDEKQED